MALKFRIFFFFCIMSINTFIIEKFLNIFKNRRKMSCHPEIATIKTFIYSFWVLSVHEDWSGGFYFISFHFVLYMYCSQSYLLKTYVTLLIRWFPTVLRIQDLVWSSYLPLYLTSATLAFFTVLSYKALPALPPLGITFLSSSQS